MRKSQYYQDMMCQRRAHCTLIHWNQIAKAKRVRRIRLLSKAFWTIKEEWVNG